MRGAMEGLDTRAEEENVGIASFWAKRDLGKMKDKFGTVFSSMFEDFKPLMEGFKPLADIASMFGKLNFSLPPGGIKDFIDKMDWNRFFPHALQAPEEAGMLPSKPQVGFQFKQISMERQMLGGPVAETLEYQQLQQMIQMNSHLARIAAANTGMGGKDSIRDIEKKIGPLPEPWFPGF